MGIIEDFKYLFDFVCLIVLGYSIGTTVLKNKKISFIVLCALSLARLVLCVLSYRIDVAIIYGIIALCWLVLLYEYNRNIRM